MSETTHIQIAARLKTDLVRELDRTAGEDDRLRAHQLAHLLQIGLAGRRRLKELEALAARSMDSAASPPSTAAADHLKEHARLCAEMITPQDTNPSKE